MQANSRHPLFLSVALTFICKHYREYEYESGAILWTASQIYLCNEFTTTTTTANCTIRRMRRRKMQLMALNLVKLRNERP